MKDLLPAICMIYNNMPTLRIVSMKTNESKKLKVMNTHFFSESNF